MTTSSFSNTTDEPEKSLTQLDEESEYVLKVRWSAVFGFTTRKHVPVLVGAILSASIAALTMPGFSIVYGLIFGKYTEYGAGDISGSEMMSSITKYCIIITALATLNWIANSFYFFAFLTFGEMQAKSARNRIFEALIQKDMAWYDTREVGVAAFLPAVQMHIRDLQLSVSAPFGEGVQCLVQSLAALGVAFYYSWNLTLVIMCTIPLVYLFQAFISSRLSKRVHEQSNQLQLALKYLTNAIQSIETVKCFNGESQELKVFSHMASLAAGLYCRVANHRSIQLGVMQFFTLSVFVQGFWYGSRLVASGDKTSAQVLTTFWAALMAIDGITGFLPQFIVMQKGKIAGARLRLLMNQISARDQKQEMQGQLKPRKCQGDIEFRQVTFSYPTRAEEIAVRDISLFFPAGETTFVIGKSGSGKSTLGQLLVRFYQPNSGQVFLDGVTIDDLDIHWLRENVTLVEQDSVLFNDSIRDNIALGKRGKSVSLLDIEEAVKFAKLESIVQDLPEGLDTQLGMKGSALSGGQKQRMALARARVRDAPVLILDESTSALDYVTRASILQAIRTWRKGKTTIVITHDITQIQPDDFLYLLDSAQLVQEGYRKELELQLGPFQSFLESHDEQDEETIAEGYISDNEDYEDEIMDLYSDAWTMEPVAPTRRPMSAVLFGESLLQPFAGRDRDRHMENALNGLATRASRAGSIRDSHLLPRDVSAKFQGGLKSPPGILSSTDDSSKSKMRGLRPDSIVPQHPYSFKRASIQRPWTAPGDIASRRTSVATSHSVSRYASYPRPLTIYDGRSVQIQRPPEKRPKNPKTILQQRLSRKKNDDKTPGASQESLSILQILKSVWPAIDWRSRLLLIGAFFSAIVHAAAVPVFAWVFAQLLATFYERSDTPQSALKWALAILAIAVIDGIASYLLFFLSDSVAQSWALALKTEAMKRILMQPREFFDREENSISRIAETLDHFAEEARNLPGRFACIFAVILIMIAISIAWSLVTSWKLALVAVAMAPILYSITQGYNAVSSRWERYSSDADERVGAVLHETFINIRTVRCLVLESHFRKKYTATTTDAMHVGVKRAIYSGSIFGLNFAGVIFVAILLFWYGGLLISRNEYTVKKIMETFLVLMLSVNHVTFMAHYMTQVNMSRDAGSRLIRLARLPTTSHELSGNTEITSAGDINFENVNFSYPTRKDFQVLHDVSFSIPRGHCTAIVGSSGSGKSTIAALLLKLYHPDSAPSIRTTSTHKTSNYTSALTVSDTNINTIHTSTLRSRIAIVSQSPVLFPTTIAANITYALSPSSPLTSRDNIRAAAAAAGVADFIDSLPQGYETLIGDGGTALSGGQAQRIGIARALVRRPDILVLDEATSALDSAAVRIVRESIQSLVSGGMDWAYEEGDRGRGRGLDHHHTYDNGHGYSSRAGRAWDGEQAQWVNNANAGTDPLASAELQSRFPPAPSKKITVVIITHAKEMMSLAEHVVVMDKGRVVQQGLYKELKKQKGGAFWRLLRGEGGEEVVGGE